MSTVARSAASRLRTMSRSREKSRLRTTAASSSAGRVDLADRGQRVVALRSRKLLFHLGECGPDDVVVVDVRPDGLGGIEPQAMNQIEIAGGERRRVRADVIRVGAAAVMVDDEADLQVFGLLERAPTPRRAGVPGRRPTGSWTRRRRPPTSGAGRPWRRWRRRRRAPARSAAAPTGDDARSSATTCEKSCCSAGVAVVSADVVVHVHAEQPHRHDDDVAIAGSLERRRDVRQRVRMADADQDVARPRIDLTEENVAGRQELQHVRLRRRRGRDVTRRHREEADKAQHEAGRGNGRKVCGEQQGKPLRSRAAWQRRGAPAAAHGCRCAG